MSTTLTQSACLSSRSPWRKVSLNQSGSEGNVGSANVSGLWIWKHVDHISIWILVLWDLFIERPTLIISGEAVSIKDTFYLIEICRHSFLRGGGDRGLYLTKNNLQREWPSHHLELTSRIIILMMPENAFPPWAITAPEDMKVPLLVISTIVRTSQAMQKSSKSWMRVLDSEHLMVMCA